MFALKPSKGLSILLGIVLLSVSIPLLAAETAPAPGPDWLKMGIGLFGGLALFLFGMEQMADGLKKAAGERMRHILGKLPTNRFAGVLTGAGVTAVIQSSSVTTVLVVGFVSAGLMTLSQSIGVIMGANIGTTVTAQIVAFKVSKAALPMITVGFAMLFMGKRDRIKHYGMILFALGLVFYGMNVMGDAMKPLRSYQPFLDLMAAMERPLLDILLAATFTALVQSSSATTGIVIVMATQGFVTLEAGIAMALGANVGTCVTAMLATLGKSREALRAAAVHVLFNVLGVLVWIGFIGILADVTVSFSPVAEGLTGTAKLAAETPRQIANANTLFNVVNTFLFIGFVPTFAKLVERWVPDKPIEEEVRMVQPKFLDDEIVSTPPLALERVRFELGHIGEIVRDMMTDIEPAFRERDPKKFKAISKHLGDVAYLRDKVVGYLGRIGREAMTDEDTREHGALMTAALNLESTAEVLGRDLVKAGYRLTEGELTASPETRDKLLAFYATIAETLDDSIEATKKGDQRLAQDIIARQHEVTNQAEALIAHFATRLSVDEADCVALHRFELDVVDKLRRIYQLATGTARLLLPPTAGGPEANTDLL